MRESITVRKEPNMLSLAQAFEGWNGWVVPLILIISLWFISYLNFLLFHTLAEFFAIFVAIILSVVSWHTYSFSRNHFLMYLGCGYFWIAMLDLAHALTFKGMGIFNESSPDTSIQYWIITRYLESLLIVTGPYFLTRKINRLNTIIIMGLLVIAAVFLINENIFPASYIDGVGLTKFKINSEYIIIAILTVSIYLLWKNRLLIDRRILVLIVMSILFTILAELCFTLYVSVYGFFIFLGHIFKIISYWLIFFAVVRTTLTEPYQVMARGSSTYDAIPDPTIVVDNAGIVHQANKAAYAVCKGSNREVLDSHCHDLFHQNTVSQDQCVICDHIKNGHSLTNFEMYYPDTKQWREYTLTPIDVAGLMTGMVHVSIDITDRKKAEEALFQQANFDPLTSLPNRSLATDRFEQMIKMTSHTSKHAAVMFIDLDNFKTINDTLGHAFGDKLLIKVANILQKCVRDTDTVARWSGDEFLVILPDLNNLLEAELVAEKLLTSISSPIHIDNKEFIVSVSIGITGYPDDGHDSESLLSNADAAMYKAKEIGKNTFRFFTADMNQQAAQRLEMESHLRNAISREELYVVYQPQIDLLKNRVIGVEALLRWNNPVLGAVSPAVFIPLAEETGCIEQIGRWMLESVSNDIVSIEQQGYCDLQFSINISSREFRLVDFSDNLINSLKKNGVKPDKITLELTETVLLSDLDENIAKLNKLKEAGINLSLDDFGTGYSSLSYLKKFPFDEIKIDQAFIRDIADDEDDASLCQAIIAMANSLGLTVVGEGVETDEQLNVLMQLGADQVQGFYYSKPLVVADLVEYISGYK